MIKQCAWCNSLMLNGVRIEKSERVIANMSHGICLNCKKEVELDYYREVKVVPGELIGNGAAI